MPRSATTRDLSVAKGRVFGLTRWACSAQRNQHQPGHEQQHANALESSEAFAEQAPRDGVAEDEFTQSERAHVRRRFECECREPTRRGCCAHEASEKRWAPQLQHCTHHARGAQKKIAAKQQSL